MAPRARPHCHHTALWHSHLGCTSAACADRYCLAACVVRIYRYVWELDYSALATCCPLIDGASHTTGRLSFRFVGTGYGVRYQELMDTAWRFVVKSASLKPVKGLPDPKDWDSRVKVTCYPGDSKGSSDIHQGDRLDDPTRPEFGTVLDIPYVPTSVARAVAPAPPPPRTHRAWY